MASSGTSVRRTPTRLHRLHGPTAGTSSCHGPARCGREPITSPRTIGTTVRATGTHGGASRMWSSSGRQFWLETTRRAPSTRWARMSTTRREARSSHCAARHVLSDAWRKNIPDGQDQALQVREPGSRNQRKQIRTQCPVHLLQHRTAPEGVRERRGIRTHVLQSLTDCHTTAGPKQLAGHQSLSSLLKFHERALKILGV